MQSGAAPLPKEKDRGCRVLFSCMAAGLGSWPGAGMKRAKLS